MIWVLGLLVFVVAVGGLAVVVIVQLSRALRTGLRSVADQARSGSRQYALGSVGEAARLRRDLTRSQQSVRTALAAARAAQSPVGEVPALLRRLAPAVTNVIAELQMVEAMRDPQRRALALDGPRSRARALITAADDLTAGLVAASAAGAADLSLLQAECAMEVEVLKAAGGHDGLAR